MSSVKQGKTCTIKNLFEKWLDESQFVVSYDFRYSEHSTKRIKAAVTSEVSWHCAFRFNDEPWDDVVCSPDQEFLLYRRQWITAHRLKVGDWLTCRNERVQKISPVRHAQQKLTVYALEV